MDKNTKRKLNLLIHLAKVDGKFHKAEKALLKEFVREKGFDSKDFWLLESTDEKMRDISLVNDKKEMLFLAIKLIQADKVIDQKEVAFCRDIATKLGYKADVVDKYAHRQFDRASFDKSINEWRA